MSRSEPANRLRVVGVSFLNAQPLLHGLMQGMAEDRMGVQLAEPGELARRLFEDEADVAMAPVAALAGHGGLELVPDIGIGCDGPVRSVLLVANSPIEALREILLDASSRTSVVLTRLIMRELRAGAEPRYCARSADQIVAELDAADGPGRTGGLLIGDAALEHAHRFQYVLDLGQAWKELTGLPFVFAAWVARPGVLTGRDALMLAESLEAGLAEVDQISQTWARGHGGDPAAHRDYLQHAIRYTLDDAARAGLQEFLRRGAAAGLLPPTELRFVGREQVEAMAHRRSLEDLLRHAALGHRLSYCDVLRLAESASTEQLMDAAAQAVSARPAVSAPVPSVEVEAAGLDREQLDVAICRAKGKGGVSLTGRFDPSLHLEWYEDLLGWLREHHGLSVQALDPDAVWRLAHLEDLSVEAVVRRLHGAGLSSLGGGGALVLTDRVRQEAKQEGCSSQQWLDALRQAHRLGMHGPVTMTYGVGDGPKDRILHLLKIRDLQDETGGVTALALWDHRLGRGAAMVAGDPAAQHHRRILALCRLVLDNVPRVTGDHVWVRRGAVQPSLGGRP